MTRRSYGASPAGGGAVSSVNGEVGAVTLDAADIPFTPAGSIAATDVQSAIEEVASEAGGSTPGAVRTLKFIVAYNTPGVVGSDDEVQTIEITGAPSGGDFTLSIFGSPVGPIAFDADDVAVQAAFDALGYGVGAFTVTGTNPTFTVTFGGGAGVFSAQPQPLITLDDNSLTGGTSPDVEIARTQAGGKGALLFTPGTTPGIDVGDEIYDIWTRKTTAFDPDAQSFRLGTFYDYFPDQGPDDFYGSAINLNDGLAAAWYPNGAHTLSQVSVLTVNHFAPRAVLNEKGVYISFLDGDLNDPGFSAGVLELTLYISTPVDIALP